MTKVEFPSRANQGGGVDVPMRWQSCCPDPRPKQTFVGWVLCKTRVRTCNPILRPPLFGR